MPYNNAYNRSIASHLNGINERFAHLYAYSPVDGRASLAGGGSSAGVLFQMGNASKRDAEDNIVNDNVASSLPPVYYYGQDAEGMSGGSGFAEGTFRDRGDGMSLGVEPVGMYKKGDGMSGGAGDIIDRLMKKKNMSKSEAVKYAEEQGYYDNPEERSARTASAQAKADAEAEANKPPSFWEQVGSTLSDVAGPVAELAVHALGAGKHAKGKEMGEVLQHTMKGCGTWEDIGSALLHVAPLILGLGKKKAGRPKKMKGGAILGAEEVERKVGGAILGNPDPYPVKGDSERIAGRGKITKKEREALESVLEKHEPKKRGRGRPAKAKELVGEKQHDLLAMPNVVLPNGVPPKEQLRGAYGGAKPLKEKVVKAVEKKLKGGKNLSGMTDKRAEMEAPKEAPKVGSGDGRKARAELVKKIMKEKGMKMIEASKYVKEHGLYKK